MVNFIQCEVTEDQNGRRLDRFLRFLFPHLPQGEIEKLLRSKMIRLNNAKATPNQRIEQGNIVSYPDFLLEKQQTKQESKENNDVIFPREIILYEDNDLMVINKPHGLAVQGGSNTHHHLDKLLDTLPKRNGYRPSSVHRLDKDTSGCLLIAKKKTIAAKLGDALKNRDFEKYYFALTDGIPSKKHGIIENYIAKSTIKNNELMQVVARHTDNAVYAKSLYVLLSTSQTTQTSLLVLSPVTGRTHQLRVHCASLNIPIIGDGKYNLTDKNAHYKKLNKLCLHAYRLIFKHPATENYIDITAPFPEHFKNQMEACELKHNYILLEKDRDIFLAMKNNS